MKRKCLKCIFLILFFILIFTIKVEATPGNPAFVDDVFYEAIVDTLNNLNYNSINDRDLDYVVTDQELESITFLSCGDMEHTIYDVQGLEKITNLEYFGILYSDISNIDISQNTRLRNIKIVNANNLKHVDFSKNVNLQTINLTYTHLDELNVENCHNLIHLEMGAGCIDDATIEELDLSNCQKLQYLSISGNKLKKVDLSQNKYLNFINISSGTLEELILPENSEIDHLAIFNNNIQSLDDIKNFETANITKLYIQGNNIDDFSLIYEKDSIEEVVTDEIDEYKDIWEDEDIDENEDIENFKLVNEKEQYYEREKYHDKIENYDGILIILVSFATVFVLATLLKVYTNSLNKITSGNTNFSNENKSKKYDNYYDNKYVKDDDYYEDLSGKYEEDDLSGRSNEDRRL